MSHHLLSESEYQKLLHSISQLQAEVDRLQAEKGEVEKERNLLRRCFCGAHEPPWLDDDGYDLTGMGGCLCCRLNKAEGALEPWKQETTRARDERSLALAERDTLKAALAWAKESREALGRALTHELDDSERLEQLAHDRGEALRFYADETRYLWVDHQIGVPIDNDRGARARAALTKPSPTDAVKEK